MLEVRENPSRSPRSCAGLPVLTVELPMKICKGCPDQVGSRCGVREVVGLGFDGGVDEVISTRRLDHIVKAFAIFGDKMKAIDLCVARFDDETKDSFKDLYTKIDSGVDISTLTSDDSSIDAELAEMDEEEDDADF